MEVNYTDTEEGVGYWGVTLLVGLDGRFEVESFGLEFLVEGWNVRVVVAWWDVLVLDLPQPLISLLLLLLLPPLPNLLLRISILIQQKVRDMMIGIIFKVCFIIRIVL